MLLSASAPTLLCYHESHRALRCYFTARAALALNLSSSRLSIAKKPSLPFSCAGTGKLICKWRRLISSPAYRQPRTPSGSGGKTERHSRAQMLTCEGRSQLLLRRALLRKRRLWGTRVRQPRRHLNRSFEGVHENPPWVLRGEVCEALSTHRQAPIVERNHHPCSEVPSPGWHVPYDLRVSHRGTPAPCAPERC